jgi:hypothetical protein
LPEVTLSGFNGEVLLLKQENGKWFQAWSTQVVENYPSKVLITDIDQDGLNEIVVASTQVLVYKPSGDTYTLVWACPDYFHSIGSSDMPGIVVTDLDGDNVNDLVVLDLGLYDDTMSLSIYTSPTGNVADLAPVYVTTFTDQEGYFSRAGVTQADFNGDGSTEIVTGNDHGTLWLVSGSGGNFSVTTEWKVPSGGAIGYELSSGDMDGNGTTELLVGTKGGDIFVYDFDQSLQPYLVASASTGRYFYHVTAGDVDADGMDEFIIIHGNAELGFDDIDVETWKMNGKDLNKTGSYQTADNPLVFSYNLDHDGYAEIITIGQFDGVLEIVRE